MEFEKIGDYKKSMKNFIKGAIRSKLFQDSNNNLIVTLSKNFDKNTKTGMIILTIDNAISGMKTEFTAMVPTRVYNKVEPDLFAPLGAQLAKTKNFGELIIK